MDADPKTIADFWPIFLSLIFFTAWLVRLEAKVQQAAKDTTKNEKKSYFIEGKVDQMETKILEQLEEFRDSLSAVRESQARVEGRLGVMRSEHDGH